MPGAPSYDSLEEEREARKERLAASFRVFAMLGFDEGEWCRTTIPLTLLSSK